MELKKIPFNDDMQNEFEKSKNSGYIRGSAFELVRMDETNIIIKSEDL